MADYKELIALTRAKATTDSPVHERSRELADALEAAAAERDAALTVIEQVRVMRTLETRAPVDELVRFLDSQLSQFFSHPQSPKKGAL